MIYQKDSSKAEEFIHHEEILDTLEYAQNNKDNRVLIEQLIEKAALWKGLTHREAAILLECNQPDLIERIFHLAKEIKQNCPEFRGAAVFAEVTNTAYSEGLWQEIATFTQELRARETTDSIKYQPVIAATREAYKRCGKDPSRYRPSAEALRRRLLRGLELYQIDTLVDLINLVSLRTGHSIGGFDADEIQGTDLELGIGRGEESFEGIGRGMLNIEGLPVYRDRIGGIGTPTSDHERTKMKLETRHILAIVNGYNGQEGLKEAAEMILGLLEKYASSTGGTIQYFE